MSTKFPRSDTPRPAGPKTRARPSLPPAVALLTCCLWHRRRRPRGRRIPAALCAPGYSPCSVSAAGSSSRGRSPAPSRSKRNRGRSRRTSDVGRSYRSPLSTFLRVPLRGGFFMSRIASFTFRPRRTLIRPRRTNRFPLSVQYKTPSVAGVSVIADLYRRGRTVEGDESVTLPRETLTFTSRMARRRHLRPHLYRSTLHLQ